MILTKMVINSVASKLAKHFKLDKIMSYVFDDNNLDKEVVNINKRLDILEKMAHPPKDFNCNCNKNKKE